MSEKPKGRAVPLNQSAAAQHMAQIAGTTADARRMAEQVAQLGQMTGTAEAVQRYASQFAQMTGTAEAVQRYASQLGQMTGTVEAAQRYASQFAQMTGTVEAAQRYASQFAQMTGTVEAAQRFAAQAMQATGAAALVERYATQLAQTIATPSADLNWVMKTSAFPAADLTRVLEWLPSRLRDRDTTELFKPLLESTRFGLPEGPADALASWVEERLAGARTATPERFAEIAETFADVELDEETERQLQHLAQDEPSLMAIVNSWGLRLIPKTRADVLALSVLGGYTAFMLLFVGFLAAPVLTGYIITSIGGAVAAGKTIYGMSIKYTPEARSQLDAAKGPSDEEQTD